MRRQRSAWHPTVAAGGQGYTTFAGIHGPDGSVGRATGLTAAWDVRKVRGANGESLANP